MGFSDLFMIEPTAMSLDRLDEVDEIARDRIASRMQLRLRSIIDPGVDLQEAVRAQGVRVDAKGDEFSVHHEDQAQIIKPATESGGGGGSDPNEVTNVEQLFEMSSGVPSMSNGKLVYRTISPSVLFGAQKQAAREQLIDQTVETAIRDELVDSFDEALQEVGRRHPAGT